MKRQECNQEILRILGEVIKMYPDFRFGQILWVLGINGLDEKNRLRDIFYEEPNVTLRNIYSALKHNKIVNGEEKIQ